MKIEEIIKSKDYDMYLKLKKLSSENKKTNKS